MAPDPSIAWPNITVTQGRVKTVAYQESKTVGDFFMTILFSSVFFREEKAKRKTNLFSSLLCKKKTKKPNRATSPSPAPPSPTSPSSTGSSTRRRSSGPSWAPTSLRSKPSTTGAPPGRSSRPRPRSPRRSGPRSRPPRRWARPTTSACRPCPPSRPTLYPG